MYAQLYAVLFKEWRMVTLYAACGSINSQCLEQYDHLHQKH